MRFNTLIPYQVTCQELSEFFTQADYYRLRLARIDPRAEIDVHREGSELTVSYNLSLSPDSLPRASALLKSGISVRVLERWTFDTRGLLHSGTLSLAALGIPVKVSARAQMLGPEGEALDGDSPARLQVSGDVQCTLPLVGGGVEKTMVSQLDRGCQEESRVASRYLEQKKSQA